MNTRSVRYLTVLKVICACQIEKSICGTSARFEYPTADKCIETARAKGWTFRTGWARCRKCGEKALSFPSEIPESIL